VSAIGNRAERDGLDELTGRRGRGIGADNGAIQAELHLLHTHIAGRGNAKGAVGRNDAWNSGAVESKIGKRGAGPVDGIGSDQDAAVVIIIGDGDGLEGHTRVQDDGQCIESGAVRRDGAIQRVVDVGTRRARAEGDTGAIGNRSRRGRCGRRRCRIRVSQS